jgi:protein transport protein SEC61 subunit alpha
MRLLDIIRPFVSFLPESEAPLKRQSFNDRLSWTAWAVFVYMVCSQIPLYGAGKLELKEDSMNWLRVVLAASKGTMMDLGLGPVITAGMIMHFLTTTRTIEVNLRSKEERELYQSAVKVFSLFIAFVEAMIYLF